ncbi:MAG: DUF952 domain-containing protein [Planctomycetota bacterium]
MKSDPLIFKVVNKKEWMVAENRGQFQGSEVDLRDGYIHFSTLQQLRETVDRHFHQVQDLLLVAVDPNHLSDLRWEPSRGGQLFPHLYGVLDVNAVLRVDDLPLDPKSLQHQFPGYLDFDRPD